MVHFSSFTHYIRNINGSRPVVKIKEKSYRTVWHYLYMIVFLYIWSHYLTLILTGSHYCSMSSLKIVFVCLMSYHKFTINDLHKNVASYSNQTHTITDFMQSFHVNLSCPLVTDGIATAINFSNVHMVHENYIYTYIVT